MKIQVKVPDDTTGIAVSVYSKKSYSSSDHTYSYGGQSFQQLIVKEKEPCPFCHDGVIELRNKYSAVRYCFHCGRLLPSVPDEALCSTCHNEPDHECIHKAPVQNCAAYEPRPMDCGAKQEEGRTPCK